MATLSATLQKIKKAETLHQAIRLGDTDTIKQLSIDDHDSMNGYMLGGKSPLTVALEVKKFGIFLYLLTRGLSLDKECIEVLGKLSDSEKKEIGSDSLLLDVLRARKLKAFAQLQSCGILLDENCKVMLDSLSDSEKMEIGNYNLQFANNLNNAHVYYLLSIVKKCFGSNTIDAKKSSAIEKLFISLNDIESIRPPLKAVKDIGQLEITFDSNNDTIQCMMPSSTAEGFTIVQRKKILIAAKGHYNEDNSDFIFDNETNAKGTIIHEITHFVMENMYDNDGKPYYRMDKEKRKRFKQITAELKFRYDVAQHLDPTIEDIFKDYEITKWESELIARASELIVKYSQNKKRLDFIRKYAGNLFQFFDETLKHVGSFNKSKWSIRELNRSFKVCEKLLKSKISFKSSTDKMKISNGVKVVTSNAPLFCMAQILNDLRSSFKFDVDACVIFSNYEIFCEKPWDVINAFSSSDETILVVDCENTSEEDIESLVSVLENVQINRRTILVTGKELEDESQQQWEKVETELRNYEWDNLDDSTKELLLDKFVDFQNGNEKIRLSEIITTTSEACKFLPLQTAFTNKLKIDKLLTNFHEGFILPRDFQIGREQVKDSNNYSTWKQIKYEELLCKKNPGRVLISDIAGTGKTVMIGKMAMSLKNFNPECWVELLDLKSYTTELEQVGRTCVSSDFLDILEEVFKKDITDLEREILREHYNEGKLIILLDSFDEISPYFKNITKTFIRKFELKKGNQLWVATRPHLEDELERSFDFTVVKLKELTREDQVNFLMQSWGKTDEKAKNKAEKLINQLQRLISSEAGYVGYPMLMKMLAEIHSDIDLVDEEDFSYFSIYDNFWKKHISNWGPGSKVAKNERDELESSGAQRCTEVHQYLAVRRIFGSEFSEDDFEIDEEWSDEKILRVRIVKSIKTYKFIHETFAEYFVAVFIINSITKSKNKNLQNVMQIIHIVVYQRSRRIIRNFLNKSLKKISVSDPARKKINSMFRGMNPRELKEFLILVVEEDLDVMFEFFQFHTFKEEMIVSLLQGKSSNYVHLSFLSNRGVFLRSLIRVLKVLTKDDQKKILESNHDSGLNIYLIYLRNPHGLEPTILEYLESVFSETEIVAMLLSKIKSCVLEKAIMLEKSENSFFVKNGCDLLKKYLNFDQMKQLLFGNRTNSPNCFECAASFGNKSSINSIFEIAEEVFEENREELKNNLKLSDSKGRSLLIMNLTDNEHSCSYEAFRSNLSKSLSEEEINSLLTGASTEKVVECLKQSRQIEQAYRIITSLYPPVEQLKLINEFLYKIYRPFGSKNFDFLANKHSELWEDFAASMSKVEMKKLIIQINDNCPNRSNFLCCKHKHMQKHFLFLEKYFNQEEIIELLLRDVDRRNELTYIISQFELEKIENFFEVTKRFEPEQLRKLFLSSDAKGNNIFQASNACMYKFPTILRLMSRRFGGEDVKKLLLSKNKMNRSSINLVIFNFHEIEEHLSGILDRDEVRKVVMDEIKFNKMPGYSLIRHGGVPFEKKFSNLDKYFTHEELVEFMLQRSISSNENAATHVVAEFSPTIIETFLESVKRFGPESSVKILSAVDGNGDNVFHALTKNRWDANACRTETFPTVLRSMKKSCGNEEVRKLLLATNLKGESVLFCLIEKLHSMVPFNSAELYAINCLEIMSNEVHIDELKQMLFSNTSSGSSCIDVIKILDFESTFEKLRELGINVERDKTQDCSSSYDSSSSSSSSDS